MILNALTMTVLVNAPNYASMTPGACLSHIRFLASDALEGRGTPSKGLDIAADYIAAQFEAIGLEPVGKDGYFQATTFAARGSTDPAPVRNVVGVLPGQDAKLKSQVVIVSAHYDHLGIRGTEGDTIYNGANDNASGVSGVIEMARALRSAKPKRTILFMCFYGEERGLVGARHYAANPIFPLKDTVANVNLEQIGRTDDDEGPRVSEFNITGFDYSTFASYFERAAQPFGVKAVMHPRLSSPYFFASDNAAFAGAGVIAHTISTAYSFPDYHKVGDHWNKIDPVNMAKIVKAAAAGVWSLSNDSKIPEWNRKNERAKRFYEAWDKLHGG